MTGQIFLVGSVNEDLRFVVHDHVRPGETISVLSSGIELGGKGANQGVAAARAGAEVRFIGAVGSDAPGQALRSTLQAEGIDVRDLSTVEEAATGRAIVAVDKSGQNAIMVDSGANGAVMPDIVIRALADAVPGDLVLCQLEIDPAATAAALREGRKRGAKTVLNAAPFSPVVLSMLKDVDLLIVNEHERADLESAVRDKGDAGMTEYLRGRLLCTLGADGSSFEAGDNSIRVEGERVHAIDTTGAGDTYVGYAAASLAIGHPIETAMRSASRAASIAVTREGAARATPFAHEL